MAAGFAAADADAEAPDANAAPAVAAAPVAPVAPVAPAAPVAPVATVAPPAPAGCDHAIERVSPPNAIFVAPATGARSYVREKRSSASRPSAFAVVVCHAPFFCSASRPAATRGISSFQPASPANASARRAAFVSLLVISHHRSSPRAVENTSCVPW
ncbi:Uncharacterised protein [Burkholderia pseudomallei]|nr:Uncharacterised protein [Burkholderia pseudomallei]